MRFSARYSAALKAAAKRLDVEHLTEKVDVLTTSVEHVTTSAAQLLVEAANEAERVGFLDDVTDRNAAAARGQEYGKALAPKVKDFVETVKREVAEVVEAFVPAPVDGDAPLTDEEKSAWADAVKNFEADDVKEAPIEDNVSVYNRAVEVLVNHGYNRNVIATAPAATVVLLAGILDETIDKQAWKNF